MIKGRLLKILACIAIANLIIQVMFVFLFKDIKIEADFISHDNTSYALLPFLQCGY